MWRTNTKVRDPIESGLRRIEETHQALLWSWGRNTKKNDAGMELTICRKSLRRSVSCAQRIHLEDSLNLKELS